MTVKVTAQLPQGSSTCLEHQDELIGCSLQSLQDVPTLLSRCFNNSSEYAEILGTFLGSEAPRDPRGSGSRIEVQIFLVFCNQV